MSSFSSLNVALTSLYAQRRGLDITGQNVANVNTEGYSRQRVNLQAISGPLTAGVFSGSRLVGQGVQIAGYTRFRDAFLEIRAALEHGAEAHLTQVNNALSELESLFAEPGDNSIAKGMSDFWAGWGDLANNPGDGASRQQLLERSLTLAASFNSSARQITEFRTESIAQLNTTIDQVNVDAADVARLNEAIRQGNASGLNVNDLMDQRDVLAQKLASSIGATIRGGEFGSVNVFVNGTALVSENLSTTLAVDTTGPTAVVRWTRDNYPATISSGDAAGLLEVINSKLPGYLADLDAIAMKLRDDVNGVQSAVGGSMAVADQDQSASGSLQFQVALNGGGFVTASVAGADWSGVGGAAALQAAMQAAVDAAIGAGNATVSVGGGAGQPLTVGLAPTGTNSLQVQAVGSNGGFATLLGNTALGLDGVGGRPFFEGTSATDLSVSSDIASNIDAIAAGRNGNGPLDGSVALAMADLGDSSNGPDALYRSFIVGLGVDSQSMQRRSEIQSSTVKHVDDARQSQSGVNIDEEMVSMIQYQHAYEAASRFLTAVDQTLDTLVNRTGVVGR